MLHEAWTGELAAARTARYEHDFPEEWRHLERAHVLSQPVAGLHVKTHVAMLSCAFRRRDAHGYRREPE